MAAATSGQVTVTTAGTAVQFPSTTSGERFEIKANPANTGNMWIGNDGAGDVTSANGYPLDAGQSIEVNVALVGNMSGLWVDADVNGEKVSWIKLG